jgi:hypothetical protein
MAIAHTLDLQPSLVDPRHSCLRVAVLLDALVVPGWIHHILSEIEKSSFANLVLLATVKNSATHISSSIFRPSTPALLRLWWHCDQKVFKYRSAKPQMLDWIAFSPRCEKSKLLHCTTVKSVSGKSLSETDFKEILNAEVDVLLNVTSVIPDDELLGLAKRGVWSFGDAEDLLNSVFWTLNENNPVLPHTLSVRSNEMDTGRILCSCSAADRYSFFRNYSSICAKRSQSVLQSLANLHRDESQPAEDSCIATLARKHRTARNSDVVRLMPRVLTRVFEDQVAKRFTREQWFIAFRKFSALEDSKDGQQSFTVIRPPQGHFYADPFVIDKDEKSYIFFEDYSYAHGKGVISYVELGADGRCSDPQLALEEDFHLAYPCIFEWQGEVYLLPESKSNRTVQLYRAAEFPRCWQLSHVLLSNVSAADSTPLHHGGKFWLLTSGLGTEDPWFDAVSELFVFFADSLSGPWTPHPKNPIVRDVRNSRSAGRVFLWNGQLIRPAQDCSAVYGWAVVLNQIDVLTETDYAEHKIGIISPEWMPANRGTHTFNFSTRYEVLDGRTLISCFSRGPAHPSVEIVMPVKAVIKLV